jgi:hypothetical protein
MKSLVLNGSFAKVLAAASTIVFTISLTSPAQAQGQWGADSCYYARTQNGQMARQGCKIGGTIYRENATNVMTDLRTGYQFFRGQDGRMLIHTTAGWVDGQAYVAQLQAPRTRTVPFGTGIIGGANENTRTITLGALPGSTGYPQLDRLRERMMYCPMCLPDNVVYAQPR